VRLHIRRSKTDQEGAGAVLGAARQRDEVCPVGALDGWLLARGKGTCRRLFMR
jgi:hypothetical protein